MPKSAIKSSSRLTRQYSNSSANILPGHSHPMLTRNESFRSNDTSLTTDHAESAAANKKQQPMSLSQTDFKNLSGSMINVGGGGSGGKPNPQAESSTSTTSRLKTLLVKYKKLKKSDISSPLNFNHVTHLDKPVPIGKRYKFDYC